MQLPDFLADLIASDHEVSGIVNSMLSNYQPWIQASQMPFFPEYTDHSQKHVEEVIQTAAELVVEDAKAIMSPADAATLVLGICLHDCAMHLTEDGFQSLIAKDSLWKPIEAFDAMTWHDLWNEFVLEARRFDGRKLMQLFGDTEPVRRPPQHAVDFTKRDRLLIGEFIRRHHTRLAHEIALFGLPGVAGKAVPLISSHNLFSSTIADISGLIARSHGMPLRATFDFLEQKYNLRDYNKIHAVYLMALLRISDYLQIQERRAPSEILQIRRLASPLSNSEWKVHASVRNIDQAGNDPEAVNITALPNDVQSFLRLKDWIAGIQEELDASWAVLGEVYGRYSKNDFDKLGLKLRRIKSNLDDVGKFSKSVGYVPARIAFETANADLLKLLVGPLYGDRPEIGLRELIQNSVDAVLEMELLLKHRSTLEAGERLPQEADVLIVVHCDKDGMPEVIEISDRGLGMSLEVIQNYFLKAGASFRKSDAWRTDFEDAEGHSKIFRSGRFGVGALAAFLIGDRIQITTRHIDSKRAEGLQFDAGLDDASLSLTWTDASIGTKIKIAIPQQRRNAVYSALDLVTWKHRPDDKVEFNSGMGQFFAEHPTIERRILIADQKPIIPSVAELLPSQDTDIAPPWRSFTTSDYPKIFWTFSLSRRNTYWASYPALLCNGIVVRNRDHVQYGQQDYSLFREQLFKAPALHVYDRDGNLPLTLQRTDLSHKNPSFQKDLLEAITDDLIAHCLLFDGFAKDWKEKEYDFLRGSYPGFQFGIYSERISGYYAWFLSNDGFGLLNRNLILSRKARQILFVYFRSGTTQEMCGMITQSIITNLPDDMIAIPITRSDFNQINTSKGIYRSLLEQVAGFFDAVPDPIYDYPFGQNSESKSILRFKNRRSLVRTRTLDFLMDHRLSGRTVKEIFKFARANGEISGDWLNLGNSSDSTPIPRDLISIITSEHIEASAVLDIDKGIPAGDAVSERWQNVLGRTTIPFDPAVRKSLLSQLRPQLKQYEDLWRQADKGVVL